MLRLVSVLTLVSFTLTATAQQAGPVAPPAGSNWKQVRALPIGTKIYVQTTKRHVACVLGKDDTDALTCSHGDKEYVFQQSEVRVVKVSHRLRSALVGAAPGEAVVVGGVVYASASNCRNDSSCGLGAVGVVLVGFVGALVGLGIGVGTDFSRSTIYRAP